MSFRLRIAAWVLISSLLLMLAMMFSGHYQLEEELRKGNRDQTHPKIEGWVLHNSYSEEEIEDILGEMTQTWLWTSLPIACLSLGAGLLLARRSLRPVHDINRQLADMRPDSLHGGITIPETDPAISNLAEHLNGLLSKAGSAYQEMAGFSARVAHELRTPLMLLRMRLENAPPGTPADFQEELQDEIARLSRFVEKALLTAKAEQGALVATRSPLSLSDLVRDVAEGYQMLGALRSVQMTLDIAEDFQIHADPDLLRQMLHGLLENSVRYADSEILISCRRTGDQTVLRIHNDVNRKKMATPGLGLGLRVVHGICKVSGIRFEVEQSDQEFIASAFFTSPLPT